MSLSKILTNYQKGCPGFFFPASQGMAGNMPLKSTYIPQEGEQYYQNRPITKICRHMVECQIDAEFEYIIVKAIIDKYI